MCLTVHCPLLSRLPFCKAAHTYQKYLIPWTLSAITAMNFKSFSSNYYSSPEIMTRLLHTLKCQADHSKIEVRFLQEGPDDKTFYEPFVSPDFNQISPIRYQSYPLLVSYLDF